MMELVRRGDLHCIIVKDLSRFGREYLEVGAYLELILPLFGTRFISVGDAFDSNDYIGTTGGMELALRKPCKWDVQQGSFPENPKCRKNPQP